MTQGTTRGVPIDTDGTLAANSDALVASQKATKTYADTKTTLAAVNAQNLSSFAATTSAQLAGVISDETGSGALVFANTPTLTAVKVAAGTATANTQPIEIASGTLLAAVEAGSIEYDGKAFYGSPTATSRGILPSVIFTRNTDDFVGSDSNTAQPIFEAARDTLTVDSSTLYEFECVFVVTRSAGTTSHQMQFTFGGTATFTSIMYEIQSSNANTTSVGTVVSSYATTVLSPNMQAANTSATEHVKAFAKGLMAINSGGTLIPQFKYTAAPGGAPTILKNSYFKLTAMGTDTVGNVGAWA